MEKINISKSNSGKTSFSGFTFKGTLTKKDLVIVEEVERIRKGIVKDDMYDGAVVVEVKNLPNNSKPIQILINRKNVNKIISDHGNFNSEDLVKTANEFEEGIFIPGDKNKPDKINLIKYTDNGCFVLGANRFNGYGVVTFFEQYDTDQKRQYLASIKKRGMSFQRLEGGGSSSIASENKPESRVPASLSGVSTDNM